MKQKTRYSHLLRLLVVLGDFCVLNVIFVLLFILFDSYLSEEVLTQFSDLVTAVNICYIPSILMFGVVLHTRIVYAEKIVQRTFYLILCHFVLFTAALTFFRIDDVSRLFILVYYISFFLFLVGWRLGVRFCLKVYRKQGFNYRSVVILGAGKNGHSLYNELMGDLSYGYRVLGFFEDNPINIPAGSVCLGSTADVEEFVTANEVDEMFCTLPESAEKTILRTLNFCENHMIRYYVVPEFRRYVKKPMELNVLGNMPVLSLRDEPLQYPVNRLFKRIFDVIFSSIFLLLIFLPVYLVVGICIKISSPGPIFFKQKRTGERGKEFLCYKFRTMRVNKEADITQAVKGDPRTTVVGEFLRRSNIDEFPQFFNVWKGEMSVVGPRPHMLKHTKQYSELIDKYMLRHLVKPGITGWAQVTGFRGETKTLEQMEGRVVRDVWYLEHWSYFLDIKIVYLTIYNMFRGDKNAY